MNRRPLSEIRARVIGVRLTDAEIATIEARAAQDGRPVGTWLRDLALTAARETAA